ncbi:MAG: RNA 2'-phosphotransferase [Saprospiraceae bacterium]|nr:RNA 2'-phosphotransferase [Saprospiraceae bacterium]
MELSQYVGKWGGCAIENSTLHKDDLYLIEDYPFKNQIHKCLRIEEKFMIVKFACIEFRIIPQAFRIVETPIFFPFDIVSYISTKDKFEIGVITGYRWISKPKSEQTYLLSLNGKLKSTLYVKERLQLVTAANSIHDAELSKVISKILRHDPSSYNLTLNDGWISIDKLLSSLREIRTKWQDLQYYDILRLVDNSDKKRHEVKSERIGPEYKNNFIWYIRARYGHSISEKINNSRIEPLEILYHGTKLSSLQEILKEGIKPMSRQFVHLSKNIEEANLVAKRKEGETAILRINAKLAYNEGVNFYKGNENIWLSEYISPKYIEVVPHLGV